MMVDRYDGYELTKCSNGGIVLYEDYQKLENQLADLKERLRWIPLTERLPEQNSWIMVKEGTAVAMCWFRDGQFTDAYNSGYMFNVNILKIDSWRKIPELEDGE